MASISLTSLQTSEQRSTLVVPFIETTSSKSTAGRRVPLFVPRSQAYFWTSRWQEGEAEALNEIAAGTVRRFSSGAEAANWLLSDDTD